MCAAFTKQQIFVPHGSIVHHAQNRTMTQEFTTTETLDVRGQNCPMPVVKTKQAVDDLDSGEVLEVLATDPGSESDLGGWAETTDGVTLLEQGQTEMDGETVYTHYVRTE
jgi:TusA-related sulfurtransferase